MWQILSCETHSSMILMASLTSIIVCFHVLTLSTCLTASVTALLCVCPKRKRNIGKFSEGSYETDEFVCLHPRTWTLFM